MHPYPLASGLKKELLEERRQVVKLLSILFFEEIIVLIWPIIFVVVKPSLIFVFSMHSEAGRKIQCPSGTKSSATSNTQGKTPHLDIFLRNNANQANEVLLKMSRIINDYSNL